MSKTSLNIDWPLLTITAVLVLIGIIMIFSTTSMIGITDYNDAYFFIKKQLIFLTLGIILMAIASIFPYKYYQKLVIPGFFLSVVILSLTLIPGMGVKVGGANRWLNLGVFQFQPVEVIKFAIAVFIATALANKQDKIKNFWQGIFPILAMISLPVLVLLLQPDLGNTILIFIVSLMMLFIGGLAIGHLISLGLGALLLLIISIITHPYQMTRINSFLNPWADPLGQNYHVIQSFIAIGSGGLLGLGFGGSKLKFFYLPLHYSDFVFSIICEEGGLIFALIVLGLFAGLLYRGIIISQNAGTDFGKYLSISLMLFLFIQAIINIGVVTGIFPVTGIPLTFISYGGSAFMMSLFFIGVLLNISRDRSK